MAGHSKWANIRFRKAGQDAKRGKLFTKLIREITVSARSGGADPSANPRLRAAVDKALSSNMTRDTIDRAIKRGAGSEADQALEEIRYEAYGPGGIAIMIDCMSDNRNRTVSQVRHALSKQGGHLGTEGSVSYLFTKLGQILFEADVDEDLVMEIALEAGADDVITTESGNLEVQTQPQIFSDVLEMLKNASLEPMNAEVTYMAATEVVLEEEAARSYLKLYDSLEELDDVQAVYSNATIPDAILDKLA